jgi:hypothetical protein
VGFKANDGFVVGHGLIPYFFTILTIMGGFGYLFRPPPHSLARLRLTKNGGS